MPDYIEWPMLEPIALVSRNNPAIREAEIHWDADFNVRVHIVCDGNRLGHLPDNFNRVISQVIGPKGELTLTEPNSEEPTYELRGIVIDNFVETDLESKITLTGVAAHLRRYYSTNAVGHPQFGIAWFLNAATELSYPETITIHETSQVDYQWGSFASDHYTSKGLKKTQRSAIQLSFGDCTFLFGRIASGADDAPTGSFMRFKNSHDVKYATEIATALSYALGAILLPLGSTTFNTASSPVSAEYYSTFVFGTDRIIALPQLPILPIRINDHYVKGFDPQSTINQFLEGYLRNRDQYELRKVLWYLNYARQLDPLLQSQPTATAFDLLCNAHFRGQKRTVIDSQLFKVVAKQLRKIIKNKVQDDAAQQELSNQIANLNNPSTNKRNRTIFSQMGLRTSSAEEQALQNRNIAVHGKAGPIDYTEVIRTSNTFFLLVARLLLAINGTSYYVDWSARENAINPISEPQKGTYSVRALFR